MIGRDWMCLDVVDCIFCDTSSNKFTESASKKHNIEWEHTITSARLPASGNTHLAAAWPSWSQHTLGDETWKAHGDESLDTNHKTHNAEACLKEVWCFRCLPLRCLEELRCGKWFCMFEQKLKALFMNFPISNGVLALKQTKFENFRFEFQNRKFKKLWALTFGGVW